MTTSRSKVVELDGVPVRDDDRATAIVRQASKIEPRALDPVWDGILWKGKTTLLAGDPGLGKSMLTPVRYAPQSHRENTLGRSTWAPSLRLHAGRTYCPARR